MIYSCASGRSGNNALTYLTRTLVEWNALHVILALAGIISETMPWLSAKDLAVATFDQSIAC